MRLGIFKFIDESADLLNRNHSLYESAALRLERFFTDSFSWRDSFLNVSTRIKSEQSLREKILRQNLFSEYPTPQQMMEELHDVIGVRIECRFIAEEREIFESMAQLFTDEVGGGYFASELNEGISLNLNMEQPQYQKNGFEIYKIDGRIFTGQATINFELQIKSLVNVFWGEIDHKVLYKNFNYMVTEDFFRDMLISIKENLWMIDKRLMQMYRHIENSDGSHPSNTKEQLKSMMSKVIHDMYNQKLMEMTGILFDFKKPSDLIVDYIFSKRQNLPDDQYGPCFVDMLQRVHERSKLSMDFSKRIEYEPFSFSHPLAEQLGEALLPYIEQDFQWYVLFRILLDIEQTDFVSEYKHFIEYMLMTFSFRIRRSLIRKEISSNDRERLHSELLERLILWYTKHCALHYLTIENMRLLEEAVDEFLVGVKRPEDLWDLDVDMFDTLLEERFPS